jgi:hypothetical protein
LVKDPVRPATVERHQAAAINHHLLGVHAIDENNSESAKQSTA